MSIIHPCRHGRNERDCLICSNEKVAKAVRDQTRALEDQTARDEKERADRQSAEAKRRRQQRREARDHDQQQVEVDAQERRRQEATQEAELQRLRELSEQRARADREHRVDTLREQVRATEENRREDAAAALAEERTRWRAEYKQATGIYDEDLVEAAWLDHRNQKAEQAMLVASVERVVEAVAVVNMTMQRLTGLADGWAGLPPYAAALPAVDGLPVQRLKEELARLPLLSFRRGKLQEQLEEARASYRAEQVEAARAQASNICWEAAGAATQMLRTIWPTVALDWDEHLDPQAVALLVRVPAIAHELSPAVLVASGMDYNTEVRVAARLVAAVEEVIEHTAETNRLSRSSGWPHRP